MLCKKICGIAAGLFLVCSVASTQSQAAEGDKYFGIGYSAVDYTFPDFSVLDASLNHLTGKFGKWFTDNLAGEFRLGISTGADEIAPGVEVDVDNVFGAYIRAGASPESAFAPYVLVGYASTTRTIESPISEGTETGSDLSYGVGFDIAVSDGSSINFEYASYRDGETDGIDEKITAIGASWVKKF